MVDFIKLFEIFNSIRLFKIFNFNSPKTSHIKTTITPTNCVKEYKKECSIVKNGIKNTSCINVTKLNNDGNYNLNTKYIKNGNVIDEENKTISDTEAKKIICKESACPNNIFTFGNSANIVNSELSNFMLNFNKAIYNMNETINSFNRFIMEF